MQKGNIKRRLNYDHHACLSEKINKNDYKWHPCFVTSELKPWPTPVLTTISNDSKVFVLRIQYIPFALAHLIALTTNWNRFKIHINQITWYNKLSVRHWYTKFTFILIHERLIVIKALTKNPSADRMIKTMHQNVNVSQFQLNEDIQRFFFVC